jgi:hypothetical protein
MKKEVVTKLESLLKKMKLPLHRKTIKSGDSLRWLQRNLQTENANHPLYPEAIKLIGEVF